MQGSASPLAAALLWLPTLHLWQNQEPRAKVLCYLRVLSPALWHDVTPRDLLKGILDTFSGSADLPDPQPGDCAKEGETECQAMPSKGIKWEDIDDWEFVLVVPKCNQKLKNTKVNIQLDHMLCLYLGNNYFFRHIPESDFSSYTHIFLWFEKH